MINKYIEKLVKQEDLSEQEMMDAMDKIMSGEVPDSLIASFLTALKIKGESVSEITGGAKVLREKAEKVTLDNYSVDTCGTGGDNTGTYNISTAVSFVVAGAGIAVAKHGNRSVSSKCGSADVLEALGVNIDLEPAEVAQCIHEIGIGFLFAQKFHKAMRFVGKIRKELGFRTIFNILGPLANPANADAQVLGVFDESLLCPMAEVLKGLGVSKAMVVHGKDGLDEITITDETLVCALNDGEIMEYIIKPEDFNMKRATLEEIKGTDAKGNAELVKGLLNGEVTGPKLDILLINAGAALFVGKKAKSLAAGIEMAKEVIKSGKATEKMEALIRYR